MKIIHTSDWHLGQSFYGYDRSAEHGQFLSQLCDLMRREQPDALLVSGDVFDTMQPSAASVRLYNDRLLSLRDACPAMTIVVTAGNHDSPSRIAVDTNVWRRLDVTVVGDVARTADGCVDPDAHLVPVRDASGDGTVVGYVAAVPFLRGVDLPVSDEAGLTSTHPQLRFVEALLERARLAAQGLPVVLMMHTAVCAPGGDSAGDQIGNIDYISLNQIVGERDYLALGHIHRPHTIADSDCRARYCGSPIAVSFDEDYTHSVTMVTLPGHGMPVITAVPVVTDMPLLTIPDRPMPYEQALQTLADLPESTRGYVRVNIASDHYLPGNARESIVQMLDGRPLKFCDILKTATLTLHHTDARHGMTLEDFRQLTPMEVAQRYFDQKGITLDETHRQMLRRVINQSPQDA